MVLNRRQIYLPAVIEHLLYRRLRVNQGEIVQRANQGAIHSKGVGIKPDSADATASVSSCANLASAGTANHCDCTKRIFQSHGEARQRVLCRAKEQYTAKTGML